MLLINQGLFYWHLEGRSVYESQIKPELCRFGIASDGTLVYVLESEYQAAPAGDRDQPNYWLEQIADNPAVWTE